MLLLFLFFASVLSQHVVFDHEINGENGVSLGTLRIWSNQEPADAVYQFARSQSAAFRQAVLQHVCQQAPCTRAEAWVFDREIAGEDGKALGTLRITEHQEPADAIFQFAPTLPAAFRQQVLQVVCQSVVCSRANPVVFDNVITDNEGGGVLGRLRLFEGEPVADVVYVFCQEHGQSLPFEASLLAHVCATPGIACEHSKPLLFTSAISGKNGTSVGVLSIYGDEEPADSVYRFCKANNQTVHKELADASWRQNLLQHVCGLERVHCTRATALLFNKAVAKADGNGIFGTLSVFDGQEPVDQVDAFTRERNLTVAYRQILLAQVCEHLGIELCKRAEPMLLSQPITGADGAVIGNVEVFEGQEPIDAVYAFCKKKDLIDNMPTIFAHTCNATDRIHCARTTPREILFTLNPTWYGISHKLEYDSPEDEWHCEDVGKGKGTRCEHHSLRVARKFCSMYMPTWDKCESMIVAALEERLRVFNKCMWKSLDHYAHLNLPKSADNATIIRRFNELAKSLPNATEDEQAAHRKIRSAHDTLTDKTLRMFYDQPCQPVFGSLCGKKTADGGMSVVMETEPTSAYGQC
jgi:hypothetical protein